MSIARPLRRTAGVLAVLAAPLAAQGGEPLATGRVSLQTDSAAHVVDPGSSVTMRVVVENSTNAERRVSMRTTLPTGWVLLSTSDESALPAGERVVRFVQCAVPATTVAGTYQVAHTARSNASDAALLVFSTVVVRARRSVAVTLVDEPFFAPSGASYAARFQVANRGNVRTRVSLRTESEQRYPTTIDTLSELAPGETRLVTVRVSTAQAPVTGTVRHHLTLAAVVADGAAGDEVTRPKAVATVRVVPRGDGAGAPSYRIPVDLTLVSQTRAAAVGEPSTTQSFVVSGGGAVREGGATRLDVYARSAQSLQSLFADRDEYRVALTGTGWNVRAGDQILALTPLSQPGLIARAVSGHATRGAWSAGGYAGRARFTVQAPDEMAGWVAWDAERRLKLTATVAGGGPFAPAPLGTLHARYQLVPGTQLELERGARLDGSLTGASLARASGQVRGVTFDVRRQQADTAYPGIVRGLDRTTASVTVTPRRRWRITGRYDAREGPARAIIGTPSVGGDLLRASRNMLVSSDYAGLVTLGLRSFDERLGVASLFADARYLGERALFARINKRFRRASFSVASEAGLSDGVTGTATRRFSSTRIDARTQVRRAQELGVFVERASGFRLLATEPERRLSAGVSARVRAGGWSAQMSAAAAPALVHTTLTDSIRTRLAWADGTIAYTSSRGQSLQFRVRTLGASVGLPATTTARLAWSRPLHLPAGRSQRVSRVMGRVYDAESGKGIANALVTLGEQAALTDDEGRVGFGGVLPDRYALMLDLGARQARGVGLQDGVADVVAQAGRTTAFALPIARFGRISGIVRRLDVGAAPDMAPDSGTVRAVQGMSGVLVVLVNGTEERRVVTDADGRFELADVRAGTWRVQIADGQLPTGQVVEGDAVRALDLAIGGAQVVTFTVRPRVRRVLPLDSLPSSRPPRTRS